MNTSELMSEDFAYILWARKLTGTIIFYACLVFVPIGVFLNIIEIIIFQKNKFKKSTMGYFLSINCGLHVIILTYVTVFNLPAVFRINLTTWSNLTCKAYVFFLRSLYQAYSWLNVVMVGDRLLFILYQNKFKSQKNKRKLSLILMVLLIFVFLCNLPNMFFYVNVIVNNSTNVSTVTKSCIATPLILTIRGLMTIIFRTVLPFILMLFMNTILIYKVIKLKEKLKLKKKLIHDLKFSFTIIVTTLIFLITLIPNSVYVFMAFVFQEDSSNFGRQTYISFLYVFEIMTSSVYLIYYSFNIFIQLAFNSIFRNEFFKVISVFFKQFNNLFQNDFSSTFISKSLK